MVSNPRVMVTNIDGVVAPSAELAGQPAFQDKSGSSIDWTNSSIDNGHFGIEKD